MTSVGDSSTRMSRRVHGSGDADVEALTVGLTHSLSRVVQEATGRLVEVKQRLYQEQEDRVTEALRQHEAKVRHPPTNHSLTGDLFVVPN